jgi:glycosyltransferase involved in cell wall biosynthesis
MLEPDTKTEDDSRIELSIVMPCLNEAQTLGICIEKALSYLDMHQIRGEVIVADNGSTDGSQEIAAALGARVVTVASRGYGNALRAGIEAARGRFVVMGDSDDSYDFSALEPFVKKLREGNQLVMGNRFQGGIRPGAMPALHRYLGNPVLSALGRLFFHSPCGDFHCGLRGFERRAILGLDLEASGMEFASEMVVKATINKLRIAEVPTVLSPDGRNRPPHLRSWRDGWRHLRFLLLFSPRWLFLYPGAMIFLLGLFGTVMLFTGELALGRLVFAEHTMVLTAAMINIGFEAMLFWAFANMLAIQRGLLPPDSTFDRLRCTVSLERGIAIGGALILLGLAAFAAALLEWSEVGFGPLSRGITIRLVIVSSATLVLGTQLLYGSFLFSVLEHRAAARDRSVHTQTAMTGQFSGDN